MKSDHNHIQREQADYKRLMQNFNPKASAEAKRDVLAELRQQKEKFVDRNLGKDNRPELGR